MRTNQAAFELHNEMVAPLVMKILTPVIDNGGDAADVLVTLVSIAAGTIYAVERQYGVEVDVVDICERIGRQYAQIAAKVAAR